MHEFFEVWDIAKRSFSLERLVQSNLEETNIKIYLDGKIIVRADGPSEEIELVYFQAAKRLLEWLRYHGEKI